MRFQRTEKYIIAVLAVTLALSLLLAFAKRVTINPYDYDLVFTVVLILIIAGQIFRAVWDRPRIANVCTALALLISSTHVMLIFNFLLLPYRVHGVDEFIAGVDARFGFVWSSFAITMAQHPGICDFLKTVYGSSFAQIALLLLTLAVFNRTRQITEFMAANIIGALASIGIWSIYPSSTPAAFQTLPADVLGRLNLVIGPDYGAKLVQLSSTGVTHISPFDAIGLIGFPSFHTVMAVLMIRYAMHIRYLFIPLLAWNLIMIPAILLHGAHNLLDAAGGVAVAAFSIWFASRLAREPQALAAGISGQRDVLAAR